MLLNENIKILQTSGVSVKKRVADYQAEHLERTLIRLDQDLMNMPLPQKVTEGMKEAVEETSEPFGVRLDSPWSGYASLKTTISAHFALRGVSVSENEIFITAGLESANTALSRLFAPENNVLLYSPCHSHLVDLQQCAGRTVSFSRATPENGFEPEPDSRGADLIYLASPSPVTGVALSRENLKKWVDFANENGSIIIYDASLGEYIGDENCPKSIYEIEEARSCAIEVFSFENGYGVRELKIAYVVIPSNLSRNTTRLQQLFCACQPAMSTPPSYVMQRAAEMLFSQEAKEGTEKLIYRIKKVAKILSDGLTSAGIPHVGGENGPFLWAQCPPNTNSWQCFDRLLEEVGCVVTPGSVFGYGAENYFRLTAFGMPDEAVEAGKRLCVVFATPPQQDKAEALREEEVAARLFEEELVTENPGEEAKKP